MVLGACLEIVLALREKAGVGDLEHIDSVYEAEMASEMMDYIIRIRGLVQTVAWHGYAFGRGGLGDRRWRRWPV